MTEPQPVPHVSRPTALVLPQLLLVLATIFVPSSPQDPREPAILLLQSDRFDYDNGQRSVRTQAGSGLVTYSPWEGVPSLDMNHRRSRLCSPTRGGLVDRGARLLAPRMTLCEGPGRGSVGVWRQRWRSGERKDFSASRCDYIRASGATPPVLGAADSVLTSSRTKTLAEGSRGRGRLRVLGLHPALWFSHSSTPCAAGVLWAAPEASGGPRKGPL